ncbi:MAG: hypothetical protein FRX49_06564 [Trebouxia sp. A1-2]|nr:MAG: hypothetical protein FRX49_06564 [Trebouxia sp. A1-2]
MSAVKTLTPKLSAISRASRVTGTSKARRQANFLRPFSSMTLARMMSFLCTGPMLMPDTGILTAGDFRNSSSASRDPSVEAWTHTPSPASMPQLMRGDASTGTAADGDLIGSCHALSVPETTMGLGFEIDHVHLALELLPKGSDLGHNGAAHATQHDGVTFMQETVDQHHALVELTLHMVLLAVEGLLDGGVCLCLPVKEPVDLHSMGEAGDNRSRIGACLGQQQRLGHDYSRGTTKAGGYLIQGNNKGCLAHLEEVDGLNGLLLQAMHHVHHQDGNVAQAGASRPQIGEGLFMRGCENSNPNSNVSAVQHAHDCIAEEEEEEEDEKKKDFTRFCHPTQPITCANYGNHPPFSFFIAVLFTAAVLAAALLQQQRSWCKAGCGRGKGKGKRGRGAGERGSSMKRPEAMLASAAACVSAAAAAPDEALTSCASASADFGLGWGFFLPYTTFFFTASSSPSTAQPCARLTLSSPATDSQGKHAQHVAAIDDCSCTLSGHRQNALQKRARMKGVSQAQLTGAMPSSASTASRSSSSLAPPLPFFFFFLPLLVSVGASTAAAAASDGAAAADAVSDFGSAGPSSSASKASISSVSAAALLFFFFLDLLAGCGEEKSCLFRACRLRVCYAHSGPRSSKFAAELEPCPQTPASGSVDKTQRNKGMIHMALSDLICGLSIVFNAVAGLFAASIFLVIIGMHTVCKGLWLGIICPSVAILSVAILVQGSKH